MRPRRNGWIALGLGAALGVTGCARQGAPPGGEQDRLPPVVVEVRPDTFALVSPGTDRLEIRFNERISERPAAGTLDGAVTISPEPREIDVGHDRRGVDVDIRGGLLPGLIYRVRVEPVLRDMFGNTMVTPFEWVFSTGGEFTSNAVVGQVWDRSNGQLLDGIRVVLVPAGAGLPDSLRYVSNSGEEGLFALRILPAGSYDVVAFQDRDLDRTVGDTEPSGRSSIPELGVADTVFLSVPILLPDTTAAELAQAEVLDSVTLRLRFDDVLDPTLPLDPVEVLVERDEALADSVDLPPWADTATVPGVRRLFHEAGWAAFRDSVEAVQDSLEALEEDPVEAEPEAAAVPDTTVAADSAAARTGDPAGGRARPPRPASLDPEGANPRQTLPDGSAMPFPSLIVVLEGPLPPGVPVRVVVEGVTNLNGLDGGGGAAPAMRTLPVPDTASADSVAAPPDTAGVAGILLPRERGGP